MPIEPAVFVSLNTSYPEIALGESPYSNGVLRSATIYAWHISPDRAQNVRWLVGLVAGTVVSAYRITSPVEDWPVMPATCPDAGRKVVPCERGQEQHFVRARGFQGLRLAGPVGYGHVELDEQGMIIGITLGAGHASDPDV